MVTLPMVTPLVALAPPLEISTDRSGDVPPISDAISVNGERQTIKRADAK